MKLDQHPDLEVHQASAEEDFRHRMATKLAKSQHDGEKKGDH